LAEPAVKDNQVAIKSQRFVNTVQQQFTAQMGHELAFTDYEKTLAQHLFLKIDAVLNELEAKRDNQPVPYKWENINLQKLALDAVHRVALGLDALIPNHIHPIPYFNKKLGKYDLDLRVGYAGKDYYRQQAAVETPVKIIYELVFENDHFKPLKKSIDREVESYEFEIKEPFNRGEIRGGFGYVMFEDPKKNFLVLVSEEDFKKSKQHAQNDTFWKKHPTEMRYKTLVHRTTEKLPIDPRKVNAKSYAYVEAQEQEEEVQREIEENANQGEEIDVESGTEQEDPTGNAEQQPDETQTNQEEKQQDKTPTEEGQMSFVSGGPGF